jgi:hypothetical protein
VSSPPAAALSTSPNLRRRGCARCATHRPSDRKAH